MLRPTLRSFIIPIFTFLTFSTFRTLSRNNRSSMHVAEHPIQGINFEQYFNQAQAPFAILSGEEFLFTYANPSYIKLMNGRQLVGKTLLQAIPELGGQPFLNILKQVYETGIPWYTQEIPAAANFDGLEKSTRFFNLSYIPYKNSDGVVDGILATGYDVTEQVLLRKKEKEHQLHTETFNLFMQAPVGICVLRGEDLIVELANERYLNIINRSYQELVGKPLWEVLPEIKKQGFDKILSSVREKGLPFHGNEYEVRIVQNGREDTIYVDFVYEPIREIGGTITRVMALAVDVTDKVLSRRKIEYAEQNARLAIESADLGPYEVNLKTDEMYTSIRFAEIWGVTHASTDRQVYTMKIHPDDLDVRLKAHEQALKTGNLEYEARIFHDDGSTHWVKVKGRILYDEDKTPSRLLGVIQDVSDQKAFAHALAEKVVERTRELSDSNEQLARSNAELEQFAYVASHDLQEPLRKIQLFNNLISDRSELSDESKKYVGKVGDAAIRMTGLIRDLLEFSKLSQGRAHFQQVDLNEVVKNVISDFELLIQQRNAVVRLNQLATVEAYPLQMNQLFFNLIGNALKFSKPDIEPIIEITGAPLPPDEKKALGSLSEIKDYYRIEITDNGIGFNHQYHDRIFTIFQQLNDKSQFGGYGIGLALCRKIVELHGGLIQAEGVVNEGARFTVILPFKNS